MKSMYVCNTCNANYSRKSFYDAHTNKCDNEKILTTFNQLLSNNVEDIAVRLVALKIALKLRIGTRLVVVSLIKCKHLILNLQSSI